MYFQWREEGETDGNCDPPHRLGWPRAFELRQRGSRILDRHVIHVASEFPEVFGGQLENSDSRQINRTSILGNYWTRNELINNIDF